MSASYGRVSDTETIVRVERVATQASTYIHHVCNEPCVGLYYVHDHIRRNLPVLNEAQAELSERGQSMKELAYDLDLSLEAATELYLPRAADRVRDLAAKALIAVNKNNDKVAEKKTEMRTHLRQVLNKSGAINDAQGLQSGDAQIVQDTVDTLV